MTTRQTSATGIVKGTGWGGRIVVGGELIVVLCRRRLALWRILIVVSLLLSPRRRAVAVVERLPLFQLIVELVTGTSHGSQIEAGRLIILADPRVQTGEVNNWGSYRMEQVSGESTLSSLDVGFESKKMPTVTDCLRKVKDQSAGVEVGGITRALETLVLQCRRQDV
jgi:hypothetical protein